METILISLSKEEFQGLIIDCVNTCLKHTPPATSSNEPYSQVEQPISQPDAVKFLGKSRQTLTAWRKKGIIKAHTLGGRVYFLKSELLQALKSV
jgi:Helix-turn-helix domain